MCGRNESRLTGNIFWLNFLFIISLKLRIEHQGKGQMDLSFEDATVNRAKSKQIICYEVMMVRSILP